jgi:hypothetical protein
VAGSERTLGPSASRGAEAVVPVSSAEGVRRRRVDFVLRRDGERWLLDDVRYEDGSTRRAPLQ